MKKVLVLLMLALLPLYAFAQKDTRETQSQITYDIPLNGPQGGIQQKNYDKDKVDEIVSKIREAKSMGDIQRSEQLQNELEWVTGNISEKSAGNNSGFQVNNEILNQNIPEGDYNLTIINGTDANWSVATSTDRVTGRLYVVSTKFASSVSDTIKVFTSSNNGISWVLVNRISYGSAVHFNNDELDVEAMNNGTTSYVYIVAGFNFSSVNYSGIYRLNSSGAEFYSTSLYTASASTSFIHPRITSDNSKYTSASYVYLLLTQDTLLAGNLHQLRTKFALITTPFAAAPTVTYRNFSANNAYFWIATSVADTTKLYNDIAFSDSASTDKIVTVSNYYKYTVTNLYLTYSSDYGATTPTYTPAITDANINYKPRFASTGLDVGGFQYMVITYVRKFSATDWDPYYQRTTNNGATWTGGYVDASTDTTTYADVIAVPRIPNAFRFAYSTISNNTDGKAYARAYNGVLIGTRLLLNPSPSSINYTPVRAGYRLAATDSCFTVVQGLPSSVGIYGYSGCTGSLTSIGNNETPISFKLSQNYPNPFNPTTKISYSLPKSGFVTLRVYDILGKEVAVLVNEVKNAGSYTLDFTASNFTSGVYFYKLETNGFSDIKKMMLIK